MNKFKCELLFIKEFSQKPKSKGDSEIPTAKARGLDIKTCIRKWVGWGLNTDCRLSCFLFSLVFCRVVSWIGGIQTPQQPAKE